MEIRLAERDFISRRASVAARAPSRENRAMGCVTSRDVEARRRGREETREGDARGREDAKAREEDEDEVESSRVRADVSEETRATETRTTENGRSSSDGETTESFAWVPV